MNKEYDNTNRGALFRNEKKENDTQPSHTGTLNVGGTEYYLSAWIKESKSGSRFFSLSVKPKVGSARVVAAQNESLDDMSFLDDIPF